MVIMPADFINMACIITSAVMLPARGTNGKYSMSANPGTAHVQPEAGKITRKYLLPALHASKINTVFL